MTDPQRYPISPAGSALEEDQLHDENSDQDPAVAALPAPGTPLSAIATTPDEDAAAGQGRKVERLDAHVELEDGTTFDVRVTNRDFVAWDKTRPGRKWPAAEEAPFLLNTFLAFCALKRTGQISSRFEDFEASVDYLHLKRAEPARPTR